MAAAAKPAHLQVHMDNRLLMEVGQPQSHIQGNGLSPAREDLIS